MAPIPPWADLPQELVSTIANSLTSNSLDIMSFRSVCKSWHDSFPNKPSSCLNPPLPIIVPAPPYTMLPRYSFFAKWSVLTVTVIYSLKPPVQDLLSSPTNWVLFLDELNPGKVCVRHHLSTKSFSMPINFPSCINLIDFHGTELGRFYNLTGVDKPNANLVKPRMWSGIATKVVVLSDMSVAVLLNGEGKLGMIRLGVDGNGVIGVGENGVMAECTISTQDWEVVHAGAGFRFDDIVEFKGRLLGIDRRGKVYEIDLSSKSIVQIGPPIGGGGGRRKRLVESLGDLFLVVKCQVTEKVSKKSGEKSVASLAFKVYKYPGVKNEKWVEIKGIGDRNFLFGENFSLSTKTEQLGGCYRNNSIILEEHSFRSYNGEYEVGLLGKLGDEDLHIGVCHLDDAAQVGAVGLYPGYSDLLWPPPSWIWCIDRSKRLSDVETAIDGMLLKMPDAFKAMLEEHHTDEDAAACKGLSNQDQNALSIIREADRLKRLLLRVKGLDSELMDMEKSLRDFDGTCTNMLNQIQTSGLPTEAELHFVNRLESAKNRCNIDYPGLMREKIRLSNGLILFIEETFSSFDRLFKKHVLCPSR